MTRSEGDIQRWPMTAEIGIRVKLIISDRLVLSKSSHFLVPRCNRVVQISRSRKILQFESFCFFSEFICTGIGREAQEKRQFNPKRHRNANDRLECSKFARLWIRSFFSEITSFWKCDLDSGSFCTIPSVARSPRSHAACGCAKRPV